MWLWNAIPWYLQLFIFAFIAYSIHYYVFSVRKPMTYIAHGIFRSHLLTQVPSLYRHYFPTPWCTGTHSMTLMRFFLKSRPHVEYRRELIKLADGGTAALDWPVVEPEPYSDTLPICLLIPGVAGHSQESYLLNWVTDLRAIGLRSVVFLNRGAGGCPLDTPVTYDGFHNKEDLRLAVCRIREKYPQAPIIAGGTSMGGITLVHYLATYGFEAKLTAAMVQSTGWCIFESVKSLSKPSNMIFNLYLTHRYKEVIVENKEMFEKDGVDTEEVLKCRTVQEIHKKYVAPQHGYSTVEEYWDMLSPHRQLLHVKIPLLSLNAADDVFSPEKSIPVHLTETNPNIAFVVTAKGGHIGFMEGVNPRQAGYNDTLFYEYVQMIRKLYDSGELSLDGVWSGDGSDHEEADNARQYPVWPQK